jgi:hypothetical protein
LAITATVALAQMPPPNEPPPVPVPFFAAAHEMPGRFVRCTARDALVAGILAYAHVRLEITPNQEPAWSNFTQNFQQALKPLESLCQQAEANAAPPDTLSGLMERKEHAMEVGLQVLKSARAAVSNLETTLTPEQKKRLTEMVPPHR